MKHILFTLSFLFLSLSASAQNISDISTAITLSPSVTATKLLETSAVATLAAVQSTRSLVQARGVAGKEQIKDELVALNEAMLEGEVRLISEIAQPALRELFEEISADEQHMEEISQVVNEGSELYRIATVLTVALMLE